MGLRGVLRTFSTALVLLASLLPAVADTDSKPRFAPKGRVLEGAAEWATSNRDRLVFGAGSRVTVATARPDLRVETVLILEAPVTDGWIAGTHLYVIRQTETADELVVADLEREEPIFRPAGFGPAAPGSLKITQMGDYLVVTESGSGLHLLRLPSHRHPGMQRHDGDAGALAPVGFLSLTEPVAAVAATFSTLYVATNDQLIEINADVPSAPVVTRLFPLPGSVRALSANGDTLRVLGDDGLRTLELSDFGEARTVSFDPDVRGHSLMSLGRSIYVGGGDVGLRRFRDTSTESVLFIVMVGDVFYNPAGVLNINAGDSVQWQKPATTFRHNVRSCIPLQSGCGGATATESFTSGSVTPLPFVFAFTFTVPGNNPYLCQQHFFTMVGNIVVAAVGPASPPGVPDGTVAATTPMTVAKLSPSGANLQVLFDTGCPDAVNHDLVGGFSASLPTILGGTYTPNSSACATGGSPFAWNAVPLPASGDFLWWVIVADDGVSFEGSWGKHSLAERNGTGSNGASGLCGNTDKDLTNPCGQ